MVGVNIVANAYRKDDPWTFRLPAGGLGERSWKLTDSGNWYDFTLTAAGLAYDTGDARAILHQSPH